jgi:hypothetical protein
MAEDALPPGIDRKLRRDQRRKLVGDIGPNVIMV